MTRRRNKKYEMNDLVQWKTIFVPWESWDIYYKKFSTVFSLTVLEERLNFLINCFVDCQVQ